MELSLVSQTNLTHDTVGLNWTDGIEHSDKRGSVDKGGHRKLDFF